MEEAWSPGSGPRAPVPCLLSQGKAIRRVPNPWGPRPVAKYGTFGSLEGQARGKGQGFLEHPLVVWGLEGLGWWTLVQKINGEREEDGISKAHAPSGAQTLGAQGRALGHPHFPVGFFSSLPPTCPVLIS